VLIYLLKESRPFNVTANVTEVLSEGNELLSNGVPALGLLIAVFATAWLTTVGKTIEGSRSPSAKDFLDVVAASGKVVAALALLCFGVFALAGLASAITIGVIGGLFMGFVAWNVSRLYKRDRDQGKLTTGDVDPQTPADPLTDSTTSAPN
jgi:hypothetical protein